MLINISRKRFIDPKNAVVSSCDSAYQSTIKNGKWKSASAANSSDEFIIFEFDSESFFNHIEINANPSVKTAFPEDFRIDTSHDGKDWKVLHSETSYFSDSDIFSITFPVSCARFVRIFISKVKSSSGMFFTEFERVKIGIAGITGSSGTKDLSHAERKELLYTDKTTGHFESEHSSLREKTSLVFDLGFCFQVSKISLTSANSDPCGFPDNYSIELSTDKKLFTYAAGRKNFTALKNETYSLTFEPQNARYVKIQADSVKLAENSFGIKLASMEIFSPSTEHSHSHAATAPLYASVFLPGVVKIANDGEVSETSVVRADDSRLGDASTLFKGIVQFAGNGEEKPLTAVQANDARLKAATESSSGIIRMAYDREQNPNCAVQGNDSRLREATESTFGIVKLCPDGESANLGVVRGNDTRLSKSSEKSYGICILSPNGSEESGKVVQANDKRLKKATVFSSGIIQIAENGESSPEKAVSSDDPRIKDATVKTKGIMRFADDGETSSQCAVQGSDSRIKPATTATKGIVELAEDGEIKPGTAVQSSDKRLIDATEKNKGIMSFAHDGEASPLKAVQSNDRRLKDATAANKGIVELAEDGEDAPNVAVQGNDKRLKDATSVAKGILKFAEDGSDSPFTAVQASDRRLKDASESSKGILRFAKNGESAALTAVQSNDDRIKPASETNPGIIKICADGEETPNSAVRGNDRRLKPASEKNPGIMRFASNCESSSYSALQSNDDRIKPATTISKGIVEFAEDGEDAPNVAVQGSDRRLRKADENNYGIVRFAPDGESRTLHAVQSNDKRLCDNRSPLPHTHDYAPLNHDFNSHSGCITLRADRTENFTGITPPPESSSVIYAENTSSNPGSALTGISGKTSASAKSYGVTGHSSFIGVRGQSSGSESVKGCGILGVSRFGAGGVFSSEHDFAIVADGYGSIDTYDPSIKLNGEGKAFSANGKSEFNGQIKINSVNKNNPEAPSNITEMHTVEQDEFVSEGDILVISEKGGTLAKSHIPYNKSVIGVVSGNPSVIINDSGESDSAYPVALYGTVIVKIDARNSPVLPGDFIVTSATPGCGMKGTVDSFDKTGTVIGKALTGIREGVGTIKMIIARQ